MDALVFNIRVLIHADLIDIMFQAILDNSRSYFCCMCLLGV